MTHVPPQLTLKIRSKEKPNKTPQELVQQNLKGGIRPTKKHPQNLYTKNARPINTPNSQQPKNNPNHNTIHNPIYFGIRAAPDTVLIDQKNKNSHCNKKTKK